MEKLEIVLCDFNKKDLNTFINEELKLTKSKVKSSHFYNNITREDMEFSQVRNIEWILTPKGTGNILLDDLQIGIKLKNVIIVLSFDEQYGDIVINFPEDGVLEGDRENNKVQLIKLVNYLVDIKKNYDVQKIIIGYEPVFDEDTLLIEINNKEVNYDKKIEKLLS
ncbi:hypothetical protein ACFSCX_16270 [Bacillus salitolerans]|uniref:Uncharacterized protein n=1 Tax=Bacillus salitolerans TaxID=1437434 RepID=A0ABW4LSP4_9BACI